MSLQEWQLQQQLATILPLEDEDLKQVISYARSLSPEDATKHLNELVGDSPEALRFIDAFNERDVKANGTASEHKSDLPSYSDPDAKQPVGHSEKTVLANDSKNTDNSAPMSNTQQPNYMPPAMPPPVGGSSRVSARTHMNKVVEAASIRSRDEVLSPQQCELINMAKRSPARNATVASESTIPIQHIQQRRRARTRH